MTADLTLPNLRAAMPFVSLIDQGATPLRRPNGHAAEASFQLASRPLDLDERRAGFMVVTSVAERLARTASTAYVVVGAYLRDLCDGLVGVFGRSGGPTLTCIATDEMLPIGPMITLGLIAEQLVSNALGDSFPAGRRTGRIAMSFTAIPTAVLLTVEDSGMPIRTNGSRRDKGLMIARLLILQLDGGLQTTRLIGGTRCVVTVPRPGASASS